MIILRGAPGSGKTTLAKQLVNGTSSVICSADDFFTDEQGAYHFDSRLGNEAHADCYRSAVDACQQATPLVVIDNTNITVRDISPYHALGTAYGYDVEIITLECPADLCASRTPHCVSQKKCEFLVKLLDEESPKIPNFWKHSSRSTA
jgi:predicted kinase